ncbi:MAG TPA: hypothetical protein VMT57_04390 [Candidatus Thermoplasmatota archaeon]|nr:hypothetical protein [Candidatus Thermoplasmatota archaeon]
MKQQFLILPGCLVGVGCLVLITYRTLVAFFSESKLIIVQVNSFGEQYIDLFCLVVLWAVCVMSVWSLSRLLFGRTLKEAQRRTDDQNDGETPLRSFEGITVASGATLSGCEVVVFGEPFGSTNPGFVTMKQEKPGDWLSCSVQVLQKSVEE